LKSILLFGGTFDPVHNGHVAMAKAALVETGAEQLIVLPAGNPYQRGRMPLATPQQRTAMLEIGIVGNFQASIDVRELARNGPTFTIDTLREFREAYGENVSLIWLIGGDAFARLDTWHEWQTLFALANFAVVLRQDEPRPVETMTAALKTFLASRQIPAGEVGTTRCGKFAILAAKVPPVSSTDIRARLARHESIRGSAPDGVCDYIEQHKLYELQEKN
jgi:nicotinate-nucleotide adenylyltransferase